MKQIKFFTMALAALALFSCSNDDANEVVVDPATPGQPVYAQFRIDLPSLNTTKAMTDDPNATALEKKISDVTVYLIGSDRKVETILTATVGTETDKKEYETAVVETTTGSKQILAVVNATGRDFAKFKVGDNISEIEKAVIADSSKAVSTTDILFTNRPITVNITNKSGLNGVDAGNTTAAKPFIFKVGVVSSVAKIVARDGITVAPVLNATYTANSAAFAINGKVTNAGLYQANTAGQTDTINHPDAAFNWWSTGANAASYVYNASGTLVNNTSGATPLKAVAFADYIALTTKTAAVNTILGNATNGGRYVLENIISTKTLNKAATVMYVKLQLKPKGNYTGTSEAVGANYYAVKHLTNNSYLVFKDKAAFTTWTTANVEEAKKYATDGMLYTNGWNYYRVNIVNDRADSKYKYSVLRNNIYEVLLSEIKNFGKNTDDTLVTPDEPIQTEAFIKATVTITPWGVKQQESNLE